MTSVTPRTNRKIIKKLIYGLLFVVFSLIIPTVIRGSFEFLTYQLNISILLFFLVASLTVLILSIIYYISVKRDVIPSREKIDRIVDHWKLLSTILIVFCWWYFLIGFSPLAYWIKEFNLILLFLISLIFLFTLSRIVYLKIILNQDIKIRKVSLISPISAIILAIIIIVPFFQISSLQPSIESSISLKFNEGSNLVPLKEKFSWNTYLFKYDRVGDQIVKVKDIQYNNFSKLDVYYKVNPLNNNPLLLILHGGGWFTGSKGDQPIQQASTFFADHGFTVFTVNYRLFPQATMFDMLEDVFDSIAFAKSEAKNYYGDSNYTFIFGRSAGAHLGLTAAYGYNTSLMNYLSENYTGLDLHIDVIATHYGITSFGSMNMMIGSNIDDTSFKLLSPIDYVNNSNLPPTFIAAGRVDTLVPVVNSRSLFSKLDEFHVPSMFLEIPWANHAFDNTLHSPSGQISMYYLLNFFSNYV